MTEAISTEQI